MDESMKMTEGAKINRTGMSSSAHADEMREVTAMTQPSRGNGELKKTHADYLKETHSVGTVPPPTTLKGAAKATMDALKGSKTIALVDKTAERLAFERTGVRLYESALEKFNASSAFDGGPTETELQTIHDEELQHAHMLVQALEQMGADPTAVTPSADLVAVESMGLGAVMADPRTTFGQCLHALLVAELADREGWTLLCSLAEEMGHDDLADRFAEAEQEEERHLALVRSWLAAHARAEAEIF